MTTVGMFLCLLSQIIRNKYESEHLFLLSSILYRTSTIKSRRLLFKTNRNKKTHMWIKSYLFENMFIPLYNKQYFSSDKDHPQFNLTYTKHATQSINWKVRYQSIYIFCFDQRSHTKLDLFISYDIQVLHILILHHTKKSLDRKIPPTIKPKALFFIITWG